MTITWIGSVVRDRRSGRDLDLNGFTRTGVLDVIHPEIIFRSCFVKRNFTRQFGRGAYRNGTEGTEGNLECTSSNSDSWYECR